MRIEYKFISNFFAGLLFTTGLVACGGSNSGEEPPLALMTPVIDVTLEPSQETLPPLMDGGIPRPLAATQYNGQQDSDFVSDELLIATDDESVLTDFLTRWNGVVLTTINPSEGSFNPTPRYLVRIDTSLADTPRFSELLRTVSPKATGTLNISNRQGLELITAAAAAQVAGLQVDINWVMTPDTFNDGSSLEGDSRDAFNLDYMKTGGAQNTGVVDAWVALERAGKLNNKVTVAVIDAGMAPNADFPPNGSYYARNGDLLVGGSSQLAIDFATNIPNLGSCGTNNPGCTWHGTAAIGAIAGIADNGYGGAGSAGPIAKIVAIHIPLDTASVIEALGIAASRAFIINMSFSNSCSSWCGWSLGGFSEFFRDVSRNGNMIFASAGNGKKDAMDNDIGFDVDAGESLNDDPVIRYPCETYGVICIGALADNSSNKAIYSNYGTGSYSDGLLSDGGVRYFAPSNIWVGDYPSSSGPQRFGGTSAASPFAAGIAALVKAADPTLSRFEILDILDQTANTGSSDPDVGRWLNAKAAVLLALGDDSPPHIVINQPTVANYIEGQSTTFNATVDDVDTDASEYNIQWVYENYAGTEIGIGFTRSDESLSYAFCDGAYTIKAKAFHSNGSGTNADVSIAVANRASGSPPSACEWSVGIAEPTTDITYRAGEVINLRAIIDDDHPETDTPLGPITWRKDNASGPILGTGLNSSTRFAAGQHTINVRYGSVNQQVTITVVNAVGSPPEARFNSPEADNRLAFGDYADGDEVKIPFSGSGTDAEDGSIVASNRLSWSYRKKGTVTWQDFGNGTNVTLVRPIQVAPGETVEVRLVVTDSGGLTGEKIVEIEITGVIQ